MTYPLIDPAKIFIYKALPEGMKTRVLKLPTHIASHLPVPTGFPVVDHRQKQQAIQAINWHEIPERHLTQCAFLDAFAALVHHYGYQRVDTYAHRLNIETGKELSATVKTLTGISGNDFIIQYTLQIFRDLLYRTDLNRREIGDLLYFSSRHVTYQFLKTYDK